MTERPYVVCQACEHRDESAPTTCPECGAWVNEWRLRGNQDA